jgi:alanine racemase
VSGEHPQFEGGGPDFHLAGGVLTIDLAALADNWRALAKLSAPAEASAVVKADAYGLGARHVVPALAGAGCRRFFVALPHEGAVVRAAAPEAEIYVFSGPLSAETGPFFREHRLVPVLNSTRDVAIWESEGWLDGRRLPAALHVDTGFNRLGMTPAEASQFAQDNALTGAVRISLLVSHLACADEPQHPLNRQQLEAFQAVRALFPEAESSLANSAGLLLGGGFAGGLTRPGISLYGGVASSAGGFAARPVARAQARILQVRQAAAGETVGYGAAARLSRDSVIAIAGAGYADGLHRSGSGSGVPLRAAVPAGGTGFVGGRRVPILGRISMDLTAFDVTDLGADGVAAGDMVELFGPNIPIEEAAQAAGTISYELLTGIGRRYHRVYVWGEMRTQ